MKNVIYSLFGIGFMVELLLLLSIVTMIEP